MLLVEATGMRSNCLQEDELRLVKFIFLTPVVGFIDQLQQFFCAPDFCRHYQVARIAVKLVSCSICILHLALKVFNRHEVSIGIMLISIKIISRLPSGFQHLIQ
jgi:hypothetical protein